MTIINNTLWGTCITLIIINIYGNNNTFLRKMPFFVIGVIIYYKEFVIISVSMIVLS
jgi:hypothetical protein